METSFESFNRQWPVVSRETFLALSDYVRKLRQWNRKINLVSPSSLQEVWNRHIGDSLQIIDYIPVGAVKIVDVGSGAGFPGLVIAIVAEGRKSGVNVSLIDSDQRKCEFLRSVARGSAPGTNVHCQRIDAVPAMGADVITARAVAPLSDLLGYAQQHLNPDGTALFLKGARVFEEIAVARKYWRFSCEAVPSVTGAGAHLLKIRGIHAV